jgi:predicted dehydrogenase
VVDSDPTTLATARDELRLPADQCFDDLGAALATVDADAVLVTAPVAAHAPLAVQALEAGRHVLVEKPFAPTVAEAVKVVEVAHAVGRTLMVSQNYRFYPAARAAARLIHERQLGRLGFVRVDFRRWANGPGRSRHHALTHPLLYDMAIHHFDLMRMVLGQEPVRVFTQVTDPPWSRFRDPAAAVLTITFDGGTVVSYRGSWVSTGAPTSWSGDWRLECEGGEIFWTGRRGGAGVVDGDVVTVHRGLHPEPDARPGAEPDGAAGRGVPAELPTLSYVGRAGTLAEFARAVAAGEEPECSGRRNLASLALAEAAARSVASGAVEPVTWPH